MMHRPPEQEQSQTMVPPAPLTTDQLQHPSASSRPYHSNQEWPQSLPHPEGTVPSSSSQVVRELEPSSRVMMHRIIYHDETQRRRKDFVLLIKILLKMMADANEESLYQQIRLSIATCTKRNRMGDPSFSPLEDVLEAQIWLTIGDRYWEKATNLQTKYLLRQGRSGPPVRGYSQVSMGMQPRRFVPPR